MATGAADTEKDEDQIIRSSAQREQLMVEGREVGRWLMQTEKRTGPRAEPSIDGLEKSDLLDFDKPRKRACHKERLSQLNKAKQRGGQAN